MNMIFSPVYVYKLYIYIPIYKKVAILKIYIKYMYLFFAHKNETIFEKKTKQKLFILFQYTFSM